MASIFQEKHLRSHPKPTRLIFALLGVGLLGEGTVTARSIFLNGIDISSASSQEIKQVDLRIDSQGNLFITAPHYQVFEQDSFHPLAKQQKEKEIAPISHKTILEQPPHNPEKVQAESPREEKANEKEPPSKLESSKLDLPTKADLPKEAKNPE